MGITTDPMDPRIVRGGPDEEPVEQHEAYLVLSVEERAKGFVRPYRDSYEHVGLQPKYPLRDLTQEERDRYGSSYIKYEQYPVPNPDGSGAIGRFWTREQLETHGCGAVTVMGVALAETYARAPYFYGATYCVGCRKHRPVGEFVWVKDRERVGS
jgi:hypothetical protein